jgi:membrane-bound lytic murein transglycosylase D
MKNFAWSALLAAHLFSQSCGAVSWFSKPAAANEKSLVALYAQIDQSTALFSAGLAQKNKGNARAGQRKLDQALASLGAAASRCAGTLGCANDRFVQAFQSLISLQGAALTASVDEEDLSLHPQTERMIGAHLPQMHKTLTLLKGKRLREVIRLNEPVKAALDEWLTWKRPMLIETYKNYAYMRPLMLPEYEKAGLPEALLFGILAKESFARVHSVSKSGAAGPLQFMPATGERLGLNAADGFDMRFDPQAAARANVAYINEQLSKLNNDLELTLAAYNGGEGRVGRLQEETRKGFWNDQVYFALPQETRDYVPGVLAAAYLFLHPEEFNLQFPVVNGATVESSIKNAMSLSELSICLGQSGREDGWFRTLRNLNPRVRPEVRMAPGTKVKLPEAALAAYRGHCEDPSFMRRIAGLQDAISPGTAGYVPYVVQKGDTLAAIARKAQCINIAALANLNEIAAPGFAIKPGQRIKLPSCG